MCVRVLVVHTISINNQLGIVLRNGAGWDGHRCNPVRDDAAKVI